MDFNYSKSVYIIITTHGYIPVEPYSREPELRTFAVPDGMTILNVMASPPGSVNTKCYRSIQNFTQIIAAGFEQMNEQQKEHIDELDVFVPAVNTIRESLKKEDATLFKDYSKNYRIDITKDIKDMQHIVGSRYGMSIYSPSDYMLNKRFQIYSSESEGGHWLNNKIQLFNLPEIDEDMDLVQTIIDLNPDMDKDNIEISLESIIAILREKGIENMAIFDFSCSLIGEEENLTDRTVRKVRQDYIKETRFHPYKKTNQIKSTLSGGIKRTRTRTRRRRHTQTRRRRHTQTRRRRQTRRN